MIKKIFLFNFFILLLLIPAFIISCSFNKSLLTEEIRADKISGTFSLILYNNPLSRDVENVAILDVENDQYTFEIFAPDFNYEVIPNLPAEKAIKQAERFIASHGSFKYAQISQIKDPMNYVIGYEFRPLYSASEFGFFDILDIDYRLKDKKVEVKIDLVPEVKRIFIYNDDIFTSSSQ
ncbi:MAG: hypothetical protein N2511_01895 [Thermodesulfovibrionales bacterium]|nr:hypothetical protein [Thermodesulfovibrionales bacterium]